MLIQVVEIKDLPDGGAEVIIDIDNEAKKILINMGFIAGLKEGMLATQKLWEDDNG